MRSLPDERIVMWAHDNVCKYGGAHSAVWFQDGRLREQVAEGWKIAKYEKKKLSTSEAEVRGMVAWLPTECNMLKRIGGVQQQMLGVWYRSRWA